MIIFHKYTSSYSLTDKLHFCSSVNLVNEVKNRVRLISCAIHNIIKHGRWWTTCTSATPSCTTFLTCATTCTSCTANSTPAQPIAPLLWPIQPAPMPQLNWSHFKSEFAGKPDEDVEAHLRTNDWIDTHAFPEDVKVQCF